MRHTPLVLVPAQLQQVHLVRPIHDPHRPAARVHVRQRGVLGHARAAVRLDSPVDDLEVNLGHEDLYLCDFFERALGVGLVDLDRRVQHGEARSVDLYPRARDALQHDAVLVQHLAEGLLALVVEAGEHPLEGLLRAADAAHRVVDAPGAQPALDDLETSALAEDHVGGRHPHVGEGDVPVAVRRVVEAHHGQHAVDGHAGGVAGDEDDGLLLVFVRVVGVGLAEDDEDLAARVANAGGPPFLSIVSGVFGVKEACIKAYLAVEDVVVAVTLDGHLDICGVTGGDLRLCHQEGRADLALEERVEPLPLLSLAAVLGDDFHVACIRGGAVGSLDTVSAMLSLTTEGIPYLRSYPALSQVLSHQTVLEVAEPRTLLEVCLGQEHVPEAQLAPALLHVLDDLRVRREALLGRLAQLAHIHRVGGDAFFFDELLDLRHPLVYQQLTTK